MDAYSLYIRIVLISALLVGIGKVELLDWFGLRFEISMMQFIKVKV